jgi:predicted ABC-type ATPase
VANRVRQGGHDIPIDTISRRFSAGLANFNDIYRHRVDFWQLFDNGGDPPQLLEEGSNP